MNSFWLLLRAFLVAFLSLAAVVLAAWPDWVLSPAAIAASPHRVALGHLHEWMWLIPIVLMEVVAGAGRCRNRVWFAGLLAAWVIVILAMPVLRWYAPELVMRSHPSENAMLYPVAFGMTVFVAASLFFRLTVLKYLFPPLSSTDESGYYVSDSAMGPPRTVQEIAAAPPRRRKYFLFGDVDEERLRGWGMAGKAAMALLRSRVRFVAVCCAVLIVWNVGFFYGSGGSGGERARDVERLGEFHLKDGARVATNRAVHAAYRLFGEIDARKLFNGKSESEMEQYLRLDAWDPAYREQARRPVEALFSIRERWLTIDDGTKRADLYLYRNKDTGLTNQAERDEKGWDPLLDDYRSRLGTDWGR